MLIAAELGVIFKTLMRKYASDPIAEEYWQVLETKYSGASRHYHNLLHLKHMLQELQPVAAEVNDPDSLLFSIFYHDAIYKVTRKDNEHQSALLLKKHLEPTVFKRIDVCMAQIEATKDHLLSTDPDTNILLDLDLVILGQPWEVYESYTQNIRKEYKIYPDFMYRKGRAKTMEHILAAQNIYKSAHFRAKYEEQARNNIEIELLNLQLEK